MLFVASRKPWEKGIQRFDVRYLFRIAFISTLSNEGSRRLPVHSRTCVGLLSSLDADRGSVFQSDGMPYLSYSSILYVSISFYPFLFVVCMLATCFDYFCIV